MNRSRHNKRSTAIKEYQSNTYLLKSIDDGEISLKPFFLHSLPTAILNVLLFCSLLFPSCGVNVKYPEENKDKQGNIYIGNSILELTFSSENNTLTGIKNVKTGYDLLPGRTALEGKLWEIEILDASGKLRSVSNLAGGQRSHRSYRHGNTAVLELLWEDVPVIKATGGIDVKVVVSIEDDQWYSEWIVEIRDKRSSCLLWNIHFPYIQQIGAEKRGSEELKLAVPYFTGWLFSSTHEIPGDEIKWDYPSCRYTMQFCSFYTDSLGFYIASHDSIASHKIFTFKREPEDTGVTYSVIINPPGMGTIGLDYVLPFPMVVGTYIGNWYEASKFYRDWALEQKWCSKGSILNRKDIPDWYKELSLWYKGRGSPEEILNNTLTFKELVHIPIAIHWYLWHQIPFDDNYPNYFPPRPEFAEVINKMQMKNIYVFPYINGRLWDTDLPSWNLGRNGAAKDRDLSNYIERYPSKQAFAPMCPCSHIWQDTIYEIVRKIVMEYKVNGVYLDQIASARPRLCFDPSHGHPLGGGSLWVDGYRTLLSKLRLLEGDIVLVTENNAEPFLDLIDGYLSHVPPMGRLIPLFQSVYSGYAITFGRRITYQDLTDPVAFYVKQAGLFVQGGVPGWTEKVILEPRFRSQLEYLSMLAAERKIARKYLLEGELLKPLEYISDVRTVSIVEEWFDREWKIDVPAVQSSVWKGSDGSLGIILVNTVEENIGFGYTVNMREYGYRDNEVFKVRSLDGHRAKENIYSSFVFQRVDSLPPLGALILEVKNVTDQKVVDSP